MGFLLSPELSTWGFALGVKSPGGRAGLSPLSHPSSCHLIPSLLAVVDLSCHLWQQQQHGAAQASGCLPGPLVTSGGASGIPRLWNGLPRLTGEQGPPRDLPDECLGAAVSEWQITRSWKALC